MPHQLLLFRISTVGQVFDTKYSYTGFVMKGTWGRSEEEDCQSETYLENFFGNYDRYFWELRQIFREMGVAQRMRVACESLKFARKSGNCDKLKTEVFVFWERVQVVRVA